MFDKGSRSHNTKGGIVNLEYEFADFLDRYIQNRGLLRTDYKEMAGYKHTIYVAEERFWSDVLEEKLFETQRIELQNFTLTEWIPMSPGQYHTSEGKMAREDALHFVKYSRHDDVVLDPYGKLRMVQGGVGCLRLSSKNVGSDRLHFLGANSSGITHQGIPVAIPEYIYSDRVASLLRRRNAVVCDIQGHIRYWSPRDSLPFQSNRNLPRIYILVTGISVHDDVTVEAGLIDVTAAVTFYGEAEQREGIFFVYSHFDPVDPRSLDSCINWMEKEYVKRQYTGTVVTDFDEITPRFTNAVFPVELLMDREFSFSRQVVQGALNTLDIPQYMRSSINLVVERLVVENNMTNYNITGDGNVIGDNNQVISNINSKLSNVIQTIGASPNGTDDAKEEIQGLIRQLAEELKKVPSDRKEDAELIADLTEDLVDDVSKPEPKKRIIEIKGENLKKAAESLASVTPTVLHIATQIVMWIGKLST